MPTVTDDDLDVVNQSESVQSNKSTGGGVGNGQNNDETIEVEVDPSKTQQEFLKTLRRNPQDAVSDRRRQAADIINRRTNQSVNPDQGGSSAQNQPSTVPNPSKEEVDRYIEQLEQQERNPENLNNQKQETANQQVSPSGQPQNQNSVQPSGQPVNQAQPNANQSPDKQNKPGQQSGDDQNTTDQKPQTQNQSQSAQEQLQNEAPKPSELSPSGALPQNNDQLFRASNQSAGRPGPELEKPIGNNLPNPGAVNQIRSDQLPGNRQNPVQQPSTTERPNRQRGAGIGPTATPTVDAKKGGKLQNFKAGAKAGNLPLSPDDLGAVAKSFATGGGRPFTAQQVIDKLETLCAEIFGPEAIPIAKVIRFGLRHNLLGVSEEELADALWDPRSAIIKPNISELRRIINRVQFRIYLYIGAAIAINFFIVLFVGFFLFFSFLIIFCQTGPAYYGSKVLGGIDDAQSVITGQKFFEQYTFCNDINKMFEGVKNFAGANPGGSTGGGGGLGGGDESTPGYTPPTDTNCKFSGVNLCVANKRPGIACPSSGVDQWSAQVAAAAAQVNANGGIQGIDNVGALINAIMANESGGRPNVGSSAGACGIMQFLPSTAKLYASKCGVSSSVITCDWLKQHPTESICMGGFYLQALGNGQCKGSVRHIAAGYNSGSGCELSNSCANETACNGSAVRKWECLWNNSAHTSCNTGFDETRTYAPSVFACYNIYK